MKKKAYRYREQIETGSYWRVGVGQGEVGFIYRVGYSLLWVMAGT